MEPVKDGLKAYGAARRSFMVELEALRSARALAEQLCSMAPDAQTALGAHLTALEKRCTETAAAMYFQMEAVQDRICTLTVPLLREILERRYLREESFQEIAAATHYSMGHIRRLHRKALQLLGENA